MKSDKVFTNYHVRKLQHDVNAEPYIRYRNKEYYLSEFMRLDLPEYSDIMLSEDWDGICNVHYSYSLVIKLLNSNKCILGYIK